MNPGSGEKRVQISLKALPTAVQRALPPNLPSIVQTEYASRYCESIGVTADKESVEYFLSCMPVKDALVAPNWTTSTLEIIPGRGHETAAQTQMRAAREKEAILGTEINKPDSPNGRTVKKYNFGSGKRSGTTDPTSGAIGGKKKAVGVKKEIPRNTLSFRLLIKTLCEVGVNDLEVKSFREMLKPVTCDTEDIGCALRSFFECMPAFVPQFKDEGEIPTIHLNVIKFLRDPLCESFFALLLRYGYWNVVHPIVRAVLKDGKLAHPEMFNSTGDYIHTHTPAVMLRQVLYRDQDDDASSTTSGTSASMSMTTSLGRGSDAGFHLSNMSLASETSLMAEEKETLFVKLENCMNKLSKKMNFNYADMSIGQRAFVACCHFVCDEILKHKYKWFVMESGNHKGQKKQEATAQRAEFITRQNLDYCRLQLQRAVHECLSDILDPIRIYGTNLVRKEIVENMLPSGTTTKIRGQYNMTSAPVRALMGTASSAEARRFLSRCPSASYVPLPGSRPSDVKKTHIERGTSFDALLMPPEMTWNGTKNSRKTEGSGRSTSSQKPFSSTIVKEHTELPLSSTGKNSLFSIIKEKQKSKYSGHRLDKFSRCPDVKSRTLLLDDMGDATCPSVSPINSRYTKRSASSPGDERGY